MLLATLFGQFPFLEKLFADSAYQGPIFGSALAKTLPSLGTEIVKRSDHAKGFVQLPKRGSWNVRLRGPIAAAGSPRTGKISTALPSLS